MCFFCCQILSDDITTLQQKHTETLTKLTEYKRRFLDLSHRVLKVCYTLQYDSVIISSIQDANGSVVL